MTVAFGNDPAKIARYRAFWNRDEAARPLVGFTQIGWFPLEEFQAAKAWGPADYLTPDMIHPAAFIDDHLRMLREGEVLDDDLIRGASPALVAIPWLAALVGCPLRILPDNVLGEESRRDWDEALAVRLDREGAWFQKYAEFMDLLVLAADGRFPVSVSPEIGPTDLHAVLRGHSDSVFDLTDQPERATVLLMRLGCVFAELFEELWQRLPLFHGGYYDAQYSLWSPGPIIRMQEDATAVYSPALYRRFVQPVDRMLAARFPSSFIHLHSTSMFLLDAFLEIDEIRCFEINNDASGPPLAQLLPFLRRVQIAGKPLLVRGSFRPEEMRMLMGALDPRGLFLNIMIGGLKEMELLRPLVGM